MNKILSTLLAGAATLALSGGAFAADEAARGTGKDANQTQAAPVDQTGQTGTDRKNRETSRDSEAGRDSTVNNDGRETGRESPAEQTTGTDQTAGTDQTTATDQTTGTVKEGGEDVTAQGRDPMKQEYEAALKQCDPLTGSQKQSCTDAAKKKHGQL